jgi:hypothetical protein
MSDIISEKQLSRKLVMNIRRLSWPGFLMLVTGLAFLAGCGHQPPASVSSSGEVKPTVSEKPKETKPIDLAKAKPDFTPDPKAWFTEWVADDRAAREKYEGKVMELSGDVSEVTAKLDDERQVVQGVIILKAGAKDHVIRCLTTDRQPWERVSPGSKVKLRGVVPLYAEFPTLEPCNILEAGPNPAIPISAVQLTQELEDDTKETSKRYMGKFLIVDGEVVKKQTDGLGLTTAYLKGAEDIPVACKFPHVMRSAAESLKPGQKIKVVGSYAGWVPAERTVELTQTLLLK